MPALPAWTVEKRSTSGSALVTLDEIKDWVRVRGSDQDTVLSVIQDTVHEAFEEAFGRATRTGTYRMEFDNVLPARATVELPRPPLSSLDTVERYDEADEAWETVPAGDYQVVRDAEQVPATVEPVDTTWPVDRLRFTYTAGYAAGSEPSQLKTALLMLAAHLYEHRGDADMEQVPPQLMERFGGLNVVWQ